MKSVLISIPLALVVLIGCAPDGPQHEEQYRPRVHFTPLKNWTNDPNGLVFYQDEYHLFYQYNPYGDTWGHMSWGHAVSKDLIHWQHLPLALEEYNDPTTGDSTMIFSGTVVVDFNNSSGLCGGKDCMIAIYTSNLHRNNQGLRQHQSLAYSHDKGRTWKRYENNPVLDIQRKDFRDPKVFWHPETEKWVMALVVPDLFTVQLYESKNLAQWNLMSEFGNVGDTLRIWECPDLFELPIQNKPGESKWVLSLSGSHPAGPGFVGMQYFVGDFDGTKFISDQTDPLYVEYGKDYYAGIIFNNTSDRKIMLGWINNWTYANQVPTSPWRGAFSIPRELSLLETKSGLRLIQQPVSEYFSLRGKKLTNFTTQPDEAFELELELGENSGINLFKSEDEQTTIGYHNGRLYVDRTKSGKVDFQKDFASVDSLPIVQPTSSLAVRIIVDQSIIELISLDGQYAITSQVFPAATQFSIETFGSIKAVKGWLLKPI